MVEPKGRRVLRCAVYTRKSSEEGLEQAFNSLHAQREACEAYILSQRHEGWLLVETVYDDGGFSGGNLQRPALQQLLADIKASKVDVVVVYKVDRLTRSLADFAKIVEILDAAGASFVSVTQAFNTTGSMGRLTLNVLLSFAQFEREVTGERIRDKIAASKAKGMWMGGLPPLGYDCGGGGLVVHPAEAEMVRQIFGLYLRLKSVDKLKAEAAALGLVSKVRHRKSGEVTGGIPLSRGTLYHLLENALYVGDVVHRGKRYPGQHQPILERAVFEKAQSILAAKRHARRTGELMKAPSLLAGLLRDAEGARFSPSHTLRRGRRYRYYVSPTRGGLSPFRLPGAQLEGVVLSTILDHLETPEKALGLLKGLPIDSLAVTTERLRVWADRLRSAVASEVRTALADIVARIVYADEELRITLRIGTLIGEAAWAASSHDILARVQLRRRGSDMKLIVHPNGATPPAPDRTLIAALAKGCAWFEDLQTGAAASMAAIARREYVSTTQVSDLVELAFLAPDIKALILSGKQPCELTLAELKRRYPLPLSWMEQRIQLLGGVA